MPGFYSFIRATSLRRRQGRLYDIPIRIKEQSHLVVCRFVVGLYRYSCIFLRKGNDNDSDEGSSVAGL